MSEGLTACGLVFGIIFLAVAVAVAGNRHQRAPQTVKRARYVVRVPTEETRVRRAVAQGEVNGLAELPLIKKTAGGVQVWRGTKCVEYYTRGDELWSATGKTARKIEDRFTLRQIMAELGEVEVVWE